MRGSPPLHLVLFAVGFALLAIPLAQLTFARPVQKVDTSAVAPPTSKPTLIHLRFAHAPKSVSLKQSGGPELLKKLEGDAPTAIETKVDLEIPQAGIEFLLNVTWPDGTPNTAVTMELQPDEMDSQSQTHWSSGASMQDEVISYKWES
jgi:hypothetical protein